ncbi:protein IMPACT homolog [Trichomonascus vanleenenianus]|uniref:Yih1p n=1 Tax=Trichomonascus vanleenenianus TaxID=2268995 RepID=UPI003ECA0BA1
MNSELQDEVEAMNAIYPDSMAESGNFYTLTIPDREIRLKLSFPSSYPEEAPHVVDVLSTKHQALLPVLQDVMNSTFTPGQVCIFDFIEGSREVLDPGEIIEDDIVEEDGDDEETHEVDIFEGWIESEPVTDRKSVFIARAAEVHSGEEALRKIAMLKLDKKIARAAHNMTAYRIKREDGVLVQDCDDDGEAAAGGRMLHLLQLTDSINVVVCVSRWYGGIHLGPDRFKHINSTARDALQKGGFLQDKKKKK